MGNAPIQADVLVEAGRVQTIGRIPKLPGARMLDAAGCLVTPGFIDIHSHSDFTLVLDPRAESSISQGVTLEVVGNCGHGCAPVAYPELVRSNIYGCQAHHEIPWRTMGEYLERLEAGRPAVNVLTLVPNGNLRLATVGTANRPATPDELLHMRRLLEQSLEEGAFGLSTGLEYGPEIGCTEDEVTELLRVTARYPGAIYATHTRNRAGQPQEAIAEPLRSSAAAGLPLQISHISVVARLSDDSRWAVEQALEQVDSARQRGIDVTFDMHTRPFGTTNLSAVLPSWVLAGTKSETAAQLRDVGVRQRLKQHKSIVSALARGNWDNILLYNSPARPELSRQTIGQISRTLNADPLDVVYDILLAELDDMHSVMVLGLAYRAEDLFMVFEHPLCMVGSDATALATDGPLANTTFHGAYTWAAWFFRHFVREKRLLNPQDAVRRLTSLPAARLGLSDRGTLRPGVWADLAIFNPQVFGERGTTFEPNQTAVGMVHVLVNGKVAVEHGQLTGERPGMVLRRA